MSTLQEAAAEFLASDGIAVVGASRDRNSAGNAIYLKLRESGVRVVPVNGRAQELEGNPCFPDLKSIPGAVQAAFIVAPKHAALDVVKQCKELGIRRVWIHGSFGFAGVSSDAVDFCRREGIRVIAGACPMMFCPPVDSGHRCMRTVLGWLHRLPRGE